MRIFYFLLLFTSLGFTQVNPLELKIDYVSFTDSIPGMRIFKVNYHIKNTIEKDITFINCSYPLNTIYPDVKNLRVSSSILENGQAVHENLLRTNVRFLEMDKIVKGPNAAAEEKAYQVEYFKALAKDSIIRTAQRERRLKINDFDYVKSAITTIKPNEVKNFTETYYWNKVRYYKINDLEYYIDESAPNFLEGIVRSNQVEINFKE